MTEVYILFDQAMIDKLAMDLAMKQRHLTTSDEKLELIFRSSLTKNAMATSSDGAASSGSLS